MSYSLNIRTAHASEKPVLFWANRGDLFVIASQQAAQSGNITIVRAKKNDLIGAPMIVKFTLARASKVISWQGMVKNNPFNTTTFDSAFSTNHTVIFNHKNPIQFQNMILKDGQYDIGQTIFDSGSQDYRKGFDYWMGVMNLIIAT